MDAAQPRSDQALRDLVDEYRDRCLWYLRHDYYPATVEEALGVLDAIQRHGDRDAFRRAAEIRLWLLPRVGRAVLTRAGDLFRADPDHLLRALSSDELSYHEGRICGAFPRVINPPKE